VATPRIRAAPSTPKRSIKMVKMTKKSVTPHHSKVVKPDAQHTYLWC
jgi:hypothetical protein